MACPPLLSSSVSPVVNLILWMLVLASRMQPGRWQVSSKDYSPLVYLYSLSIDNLYHFYSNIQCQKIFWVGCHDAGYLKDLQQYTSDPRSRDRIVLVETTPAQPVFRTQLPFAMTKFDHVFRSTRLIGEESEYNATSDFSIPPDYSPTSVNNSPARSIELPVLTNVSPSRPSPVKQSTGITLPPWTPVVPGLVQTPETLSISQPQTYSPSLRTASPPYSPCQPSQIYFTEIPLEQPQPKPQAQIHEWPNLITSGNGGFSIRYTPPSPSTPSYASVGGPNHQNMFMQTVKSTRRILLNMNGFRLDDPNFKPGDKSASDSYFNKLQKVKFHSRGFCNYRYLQGECRKGVTCPMEHNVLLSEDELSVHRYRARLGRCINRTSCRDYGCFFSHHCPYMPNCTRSKCKFDEHFEGREGEAW